MAEKFDPAPHDKHAVDPRAAELAESPLQLALARKQLSEIRNLKQSSVRNVHWTKPLTVPALVLSAGFVVMFVVMLWK